jgi:hypothetical protein
LPQGYDRKEADEADDDHRGFKDTSRDIAKGDALALPLEDGEQHDRGGDGGDDLQERAQLHARVGAGTGDVADVVEHRVVEEERRDGRDEARARGSCRCHKTNARSSSRLLSGVSIGVED